MSGLAMTTSSEESVELEAKTVRMPRLSRHRARRRKRIAARSLLILALVIGVLAISDFAYNAYERARGFEAISVVDEDGRRVAKVYDDPPNSEEHQQLDAAAALLAAAFLLTSSVISRKIKRHRR